MARRTTCLLLSSFVKSGSLGNTVVMALPDDICVWWEGEEPLNRLPIPCKWLAHFFYPLYVPNLDVSSSINLSPDTHDIFAASNAQHCAADLFTGFHELVAYNSQ